LADVRVIYLVRPVEHPGAPLWHPLIGPVIGPKAHRRARRLRVRNVPLQFVKVLGWGGQGFVMLFRDPNTLRYYVVKTPTDPHHWHELRGERDRVNKG